MNTSRLNLLFLTLLILFSTSCSRVKVSTGKNYESVRFPDGSVAWLNKNSSVEFDSEFKERTVKQKGEVFYDVKKSNSPFIVQTSLGEVKVLGTKFNVKSSGKDIEVEVESGSVELKIDALVKNIKKGQKAVFHEAEKNIRLAKAEWKHRNWTKGLEKDFSKLGKDFKKESKKLGREIKKEFNQLKKNTRN